MEFIGTIIEVSVLKSGTSKTTGNEWAAQEYVIEGYDQYKKKMVFEVFGLDKIHEFDIQRGEALKVFFDIDANNFSGKWFNRIRAYKVQRLADQTPAEAAAEYTHNAPF